MLRYFQPKMYLKSYQDLDLKRLQTLNKQLIICDIDNTLVAHTTATANDSVVKFINKLLEANFLVVLVSNNSKARVEKFANSLNLEYFSNAKKPLKFVYKDILNHYQLPAEAAVAIGDQLLTDVLGANRMRIFSVLTKPLVKRDIFYTKINRFFENIVYFLLDKAKLLTKGKYYDYL